MQYPAPFTPAEERGFVVTFRNIPEAITQGDDEAEALQAASDALLNAMEFYFEDRRAVPPPSSAQKGECLIRLPLSVAAKVLLLNELATQGVRPAELARRMGIKPQEVNRLIDLHHATKIDTITDALAAMGRELDVVIV